MESYNLHRAIVHLHVFIDVVFRPEDRELTIETLGYLDTYFEKWFMHVCYRAQQDQVGKEKNTQFARLALELKQLDIELQWGLLTHLMDYLT